jgi:pantothenate kinase
VSLAALADDIARRAAGRPRYIVAVAGAPGAGKSTFGAALVEALEAAVPGRAVLMPMDGYHFDNAVLAERGLLARKGSPETFDVAGLDHALGRIRAGDGPVAVPVFDRDLDLARAGARLIRPEQAIVVVEGNYLLLERSPWDLLAVRFDRTVFLDVPMAVLRRRLLDRWLGYGLDAAEAEARAEGNDLPNAALVCEASRPADYVWRNDADRATAATSDAR